MLLILPADIALAAADLELANEPGKDFLLHEAINLSKKMNMIIF